MCTSETSVSVSNLCGTVAVDLVKSCHRRSCVGPGLPAGISTSGQRVFAPERARQGHRQQRVWVRRKGHAEKAGRRLPETRGTELWEPGAVWGGWVRPGPPLRERGLEIEL